LAFFTRTQTGSLVSRMAAINETLRVVGVVLSESMSVLLNLVLVLAAMFCCPAKWPGNGAAAARAGDAAVL